MDYLYIAPTKDFNTGDITGSDVHVTEVVKSLSKNNDITLVCKNGSADVDSIDTINCFEIPVPILGELLILLQSFLATSLLLFKNNYHVIYSRSDINIIYCIILSKISGVDYVVEVNGISAEDVTGQSASGIYWLIKSPLNNLADNVIKYADHVIAVTPSIENTLVNRYSVHEDNLSVVENGVNVQHFQPHGSINCTEKSNIDNGLYYVGFVGNFRRWHGLETLVRSVEYLDENDTEVRIVLVGDGEIRPELENISHNLGVYDRISFVGKVPYKDVPKYINSFDITVAPFSSGRNDATGVSPLKIYEYLACNKPVVVTDVPNMEFIRENELGVICEKDNPKMLSRAIEYCSNNIDSFQNQREYVVENNSWEAVAREINSIVVETNNR